MTHHKQQPFISIISLRRLICTILQTTCEDAMRAWVEGNIPIWASMLGGIGLIQVQCRSFFFFFCFLLGVVWAGAHHFYNIVCTSSEDSDQPARPCRLVRVFAVARRLFGSLDNHIVPCEDSDQTARIRRLIRLQGYQADLSIRWTYITIL